mmetsp:Transcript_39966/g.96171  ORF Transcript_39966/g.96171 Transcript_39966/m.96171 type:complete len:103 (-) Transcript_39966:237-545(-)
MYWNLMMMTILATMKRLWSMLVTRKVRQTQQAAQKRKRRHQILKMGIQEMKSQMKQVPVKVRKMLRLIIQRSDRKNELPELALFVCVWICLCEIDRNADSDR